MTPKSDGILELFSKIGKESEFKLFWEKFSGASNGQFAVIKISGESIEKHMDRIAADIALLNKLGIYPIVVHGAGTTLDKVLSNSKKLNGLRITNKADLQVIKGVFNSISTVLENKINQNGGLAQTMETVFECKTVQGLGQVGEITKVKLGKVENALAKNCTPIISPMGVCGQTEVNINADSAAKELAKAVCPKKLIMITETGGVLDKGHKIIPFLNLSSENALEGITGGMLLKVKEIGTFLSTGIDCAVVITSPDNLLNELFTVKGSGTFIKSHSIKSSSCLDSSCNAKLKCLLEAAFEKKLVENYFEEEIKDVFYQKDFEGAAILKEVNGVPYLDKFAVAKHVQGTGLGKSIWDEVEKKYPVMIWRANPSNPINGFYVKKCHGFMKSGEWNIYWKNLKNNEIGPAVKATANKMATLSKAGA